MTTILQFLRTFPFCPICHSKTGPTPDGRPGVYSCTNKSCLKFAYSVATICPDLSETILELQLNEVRYKYLFSSKIIMYYNTVNPRGHGETMASNLTEPKAVALFKSPEKLISKFPMRGAHFSPHSHSSRS